jgi:IPT/TIG domain
MARLGFVRTLAVSAVLAAGALTGCEAGPSLTDGSAPRTRAELRRGPDPGANHTGDDQRGTDREAQRASDERSATVDGGAAVQLQARTLEVDADPEVSPGVPEPPQQGVVPDPRPSTVVTAGPDAEGSASPVIEDVWPNKAPASGGEKVEIRGKNLRASSVLFGSVPARILGVREAAGTVTLTVATPPARAGAAQVFIVVTNRDGSYAVAGEKFQYYN